MNMNTFEKRHRQQSLHMGLLMVLLLCSSTRAQYGGGSGTPEEPYLIYTAEQLNEIDRHAEDMDKCFRLAADIDLSGYDGSDFRIIGKESGSFSGIFDGNGKAVRHFTYTPIPGQGGVGLFAALDRARIQDLLLVDPHIGGDESIVGALVGYSKYATLERCAVRGGSVQGRQDVGALVGRNDGYVVQCAASTEVTGKTSVGGLVGYSRYGSVSNSYALGAVAATSHVGGLVGQNGWQSTVAYCYSAGLVQGQTSVGGLLGTGAPLAAVDHCFWDVETSGQATSAGGTGKTTLEMWMGGTYVGWGAEGMWTIEEGADYPRLAWECRPGGPLTTPSFPSMLGRGTPEEPYLIHTADEFILIGLFPYEWDKHYRLMSDIDLSQYSPSDADLIGRGVRYPSYAVKCFTGVFDGNGKRILNFTRVQTDDRPYQQHVGLFGCVGDGEIRDVVLVDPNVNMIADAVGGLVGRIESGAKITRCRVEGGTISGRGQVGGLIGESYLGTVTGCDVRCAVSGTSSVGGVVGSNRGDITTCVFEGQVFATEGHLGGLTGSNAGTISWSMVSADVVGAPYCGQPAADPATRDVDPMPTATHVGGMVGDNMGNVLYCGAAGRVSGNEIVGGLVGDNNGTVADCFSTSEVCGRSFVGGLTGQNGVNNWDVVFRGRVYDGYASGPVYGTDVVGGLAGYNDHWGTIARSFSSGLVTGTTEVGGLVGRDRDGEVLRSFWDTDSSGCSVSAGGTGRTTTEMYDPNTYLDAGWLFVEAPDGPDYHWAEPQEGGYPILWWQLSTWPELPAFSGGTGTPNDPYLLATAEDLIRIGANPRLMSAHFMLLDDVDLTGIDMPAIGNSVCPFVGVFEGNKKSIRQLRLARSDQWYVGLFSYVCDGEIRDVRLVSPDVEAPGCHEVGALVGRLSGGTVSGCDVVQGRVNAYERVGLLIGSARGMVAECHADGDVTGSSTSGGLAGVNSGTLSHCSAAGTISGGSFSGGLVGVNDLYGRLDHCSAESTVRGSVHVGGLAGRNNSPTTITDCHARGVVSGSSFVGGLLGSSKSSIPWPRESAEIARCHADTTTDGLEAVGGLVGHAGYPSVVLECFAKGSVVGDRDVGGLVGRADCVVSMCYAHAAVDGHSNVGGLTGENRRIVQGCYSTGYVSGEASVGGLVGSHLSVTDLESCLWDVQTSHQPDSVGSGPPEPEGATGRTTAEMWTARTFIDAGWDFVDETENGTDDIWWILEGQDYPRLWWERGGEPPL